MTAMGLYERLGTHNRVLWHWHAGDAKEQVMRKCLHADVYLASVNGMSEDGTLVNIDRFGNRLAATLYGPGKVYFVVGRNKLCPTYEAALERARNVASPQNARRIGCKTPCVAGGRCYNCKSPERICRGLTVLWGPMLGREAEVVLIDEDLGY